MEADDDEVLWHTVRGTDSLLVTEYDLLNGLRSRSSMTTSGSASRGQSQVRLGFSGTAACDGSDMMAVFTDELGMRPAGHLARGPLLHLTSDGSRRRGISIEQ